jgi:spore germination protein YaaH
MLLIFLIGFFAVPFFSCLPAGRVLAADTAQYNLEKIFYLPKYNAVKGVESLNKNWQKIDILAPQYHVVNANFTISGGFGPKLKKAIKDHNLKVMPLIANANFSQKIIHNLLLSPVAQDKVINYLIKGALTNGYIGWQFDFENISYLDKDLYTAFVKRANLLFKENNLVFSVVVVPRTADYENTNAFKNWSGAYDYKAIAENADFVSLMAYDDPNSEGPVASLPFVNKTLAYVKDKIPAEKLSLGVPLYYWKWNADTNTKLGSGLFKNVLAITSSFRHVLSFDQNLGVSCLSYSYNKKNYEVWFEDKQSFKAKLDIMKDNNLRGFSAWLLGGEDPAIWSLLSNSR